MQVIEEMAICDLSGWPNLLAKNQTVLIRTPISTFRPVARVELRAALRRALTRWSGFPDGALPLMESACGPVWTGEDPLDISLSYGISEGLIGLRHGGRIGVDIMPVQPLAEMKEVARWYLGPDVMDSIIRAGNPALEFAAAWTERESRVKCLKIGLTEWTEEQARMEALCASHRLVLGEDVVGCMSVSRA